MRQLHPEGQEMSSRIYDRTGEEISIERYAKLKMDSKYSQVAKTIVNDLFVSTVWLGLDHSFGHGDPLIFETMVFNKSGQSTWVRRYSTEPEAKQGHKEKVKEIREGIERVEGAY